MAASVTVRPLVASDRDSFRLFADESAFFRYTIFDLRSQVSIDEFFEDLLNSGMGYAAVGPGGSGFIGFGVIKLDLDRREVDLAYYLLEKFWGKGYGRELLQNLEELARKLQEVDSYVATCDPSNARSLNLLVSEGYRQLPLRSHVVHTHSGRKDRLFFSKKIPTTSDLVRAS